MRNSISVCIATYNGQRYIIEQLNSILLQINEGDEIVIIDDNSSDNTVRLIESLEDKRIKIRVNKENRGVVKSFEEAIGISQKEIVFLSDQDDIWLPNKVSRMVEELSAVDLVVHDAYIYEDGKIALDTFQGLRRGRKGLIFNIYKNSFIGCCIAFHSYLKKSFLPFPDNIPMHDAWIGISTELNGKVSFISDRLILYRRHSSNVTAMERGSMALIFKNRINIIIPLLKKLRGKII